MKPSTLTPTGLPNNRGFIVTTHYGATGRTYHRESYIRDYINVYLEVEPGVYSEHPTRLTRELVTITGYID